jgi:hypothetical protein
MILGLYGFLVLISLVLIIIGLTRPTESAQALVGFAFLFILSVILVQGNLEYQIGSLVNSSYSYDASGKVNFTTQQISDQYVSFVDVGTSNTQHWIGYYLALASAAGFLGTLFSLRGRTKNEE